MTEALGVLSSSLDPDPAKNSPVYSLDQGLYGAAWVTDLKKLPVDLVGTWTATFQTPDLPTGPALPPPNAGDNQAYPIANLTKPKSQSPWSQPACDTTLDPANQTQKPCSNAGPKVHDEKLAWWDVSLLVPVQGYKDLTFQVSTPPSANSAGTPNMVTSNTVTRTNAYAMINWMPMAQDLNNPPALSWPYFAAGLPLAGKVFDKPYLVVAESINIPNFLKNLHLPSNFQNYVPFTFNPAFGWIVNKEFHTTVDPKSNAVTQTAYRAFKPAISVGISFRSISSAVKTGLGKPASK